MKTQGGFLMTQIKQVGGRVFEQLLKERGISEFNGAQGKILYVLWEYSPLSITAIAGLTSLAKTTLTSMLDRMEDKELIVRTANKQNRREILIELTDKARALQQDYLAISDAANDIYYRGFSEEEILLHEKHLARILANLEECEEQNRRKTK